MKLLAQYTLLEPSVLPGAPSNADVSTYFGGIIKTLFAVGAVLAVVMIAIGGIQYMMSDIVTDKQSAKGKIGAAIAGLFILICIGLILQTINPELLHYSAFLDNIK